MYVIRDWGRDEVEPVPEMYCPACRAASVAVEHGAGDYYVGPNYYCFTCGSTWTIQGPTKPNDLITST
jgi:hypothetical protein